MKTSTFETLPAIGSTVRLQSYSGMTFTVVRVHPGANMIHVTGECTRGGKPSLLHTDASPGEFEIVSPVSQENPAQEQQAGENEAPAPVCCRCGGDRDAGTSDAMQPGDTLCASCDAEYRETEAPAPVGMSPAVAFFYNNAGFSYDPETETPAEGRLRCAKALAEAETRASEAGIFYRWELDGSDSREWSDDEPATPTWICRMFDDESNVLDSISGVDFGDREPWGEPYRRETEAQLALQWCNSKGPDETEAPDPVSPPSVPCPYITFVSGDYTAIKNTETGASVQWLGTSKEALETHKAECVRKIEQMQKYIAGIDAVLSCKAKSDPAALR